ncbi:MAG: hypothetical protein A4E73_01359 [Syntrophaceae bacterium PtaU1.Bin231]|nr:MAG: hypothetical protein A4E73_01359 [Syntrophaceae bacterium PtaU1.Bin231]HOG16084.1 hypothetical protein [Syntrophales bacterium]
MKNSAPLKCPRCNKNMTRETFYTDFEKFSGWRCIMCGEVMDPVILGNRRLTRPGHAAIVSPGGSSSSPFA